MADILQLQNFQLKFAATSFVWFTLLAQVTRAAHWVVQDFLVALYNGVMTHNPKNFTMDGKGEDLFFLSNGHISPVFYSVLARCGYFPVEELKTFRRLNTRLQGHPTTHDHLPGVRIASGSLGQGMSVAIGAALTKKLNKDNSIIYSLHGDGELQEGQIWEALLLLLPKK